MSNNIHIIAGLVLQHAPFDENIAAIGFTSTENYKILQNVLHINMQKAIDETSAGMPLLYRKELAMKNLIQSRKIAIAMTLLENICHVPNPEIAQMIRCSLAHCLHSYNIRLYKMMRAFYQKHIDSQFMQSDLGFWFPIID